MHKSVATIQNPEFINLQPVDLNPLMSSCEIKVLYIGENRNKSYIDKETAIEMSKTLRGAPIVGAYKENKEDFIDHGEQIIIDDEGIKVNYLTKPYGFVAPDARVWFQKFIDTDDFGNEVEREYLMTTGFLWTGQFPECEVAIKEGRPHSMELDQKTLQGHWAKNSKNDMEFFIINDAIFSKLCILGEDVEPCFEGSSITAPNVSSTFTKLDADFRNTLYSMMQDLKNLNFALQGGKEMDENTEVQEIQNENAPELDPAPVLENTEQDLNFSKTEEGNAEEKEPEEQESKLEEDDKEKEYSLLKQQYAELNDKYTQLQGIEEKYNSLLAEYDSLIAFKKKVEDAEKDKLIDSFYMLSDEDKADVIKNKSDYTLEEIESKLSVICVRKKVNFAQEDNKNINPESAILFTLTEEDNVPAWVKACAATQKRAK